MALLSPLYESRASLAISGAKPGDPALADVFAARGTASGQSVTSDSAMRVSAVYACVTVLSQTLAMLPKYVKVARADGGRDLLPSHRLYKQIHNKPNRWQTSFEYFEMMEGHRLLRGNAYARIVRNTGRGLNELVPMHPDRVYPYITTPNGQTIFLYDTSPPPPAGSTLYYQYFPMHGEVETLMASEVHHVKGYSSNGIIGMNPITRAAREAVGLAMATEEHGARLFSNGAQISKAFKHPGKLSDAAYDRLKGSLKSEYGGVGNAHKTIILEEGMDIASLSMTSENAQFLETRKFQVEDIARIFNVPLVLIGHGDKAPTYASAEQFFMSFKVHTMNPIVRRWEEAMERDLLWPIEIGNVTIDIDMDSMMRGDAVARSTYLQKRFQMASMSPDDIRRYEGENPTGTDSGESLYIMSNMIPLSQAGLTPGAQPAEATP